MMLFALLAKLLIAHAVCDYPLQGDFLAKAKNHTAPIPGVPWYQALSAHAAIHAGAVWIVTGSGFLGGAEFVMHWLIDWAKSDESQYRAETPGLLFNLDQLAHVMCKVLWVVWAISA